MSKKIIFFIAYFILVTSLSAQQRSKDLVPKNFFKAGEYARYKVIYKLGDAWVTAGKVHFETSARAVDGIPHIVLTAKGNTAPAFDMFYKVRDEYATVMNPKTFLPKYFLRKVNEGGFKIYNNFDFEHKEGIVTAEMEDSKTTNTTNKYSIEPNTQDVVSAILYCRNLDYGRAKEGDTFKFPIFIDRETYHVGIIYKGKKMVSTDYGDFKCFITEPVMASNRIYSDKDKITIYISDDTHRLPILVEAPLKVGRVVGVLEKYTVK